MCMYILLIHSSTDEHLDGFYLLAIMINADINIYVQVSVWTNFFIFISIYLGLELQSYGSSVFKFLKDC